MDGLKGATVKPHNDLVEDAKDQIVNDGKVEATPGSDLVLSCYSICYSICYSMLFIYLNC